MMTHISPVYEERGQLGMIHGILSFFLILMLCLLGVGIWALTGDCFNSEGIHSLLPTTDVVVVHRPSTGQSAFVPWPELMQACGHLMTPTRDLPVRYEVLGFPDERVFQSLSCRFDKFGST